MNRVQFLQKYQIDFRDLKHINLSLNEIFPSECIFVFDTESCYKEDNKDTPLKIYDIKKKRDVFNPDFNTDVHVYAWSLANNMNDYAVIGQNLNQFFELINMIGKARVPYIFNESASAIKEYKRELKLECWVHNLSWDIEFLKYSLNDANFSYYHNEVKKGLHGTKQKKNSLKVREANKFNIVENTGTVYSSTINFDKLYSVKYKYKKETVEEDLFVQLNLYDSAKISVQSLDTIAKHVIQVDSQFKKIGGYDYEKIRLEGHELTYDERDYLYNDTYILKEWYNQFYLPIGTECKTASSIAFEKFINGTFGQESKSKNMTEFEKKYPDLTKYKEPYVLINNSYKGGWTQANKAHIHKHILCKGVSIDINSSYPSAIYMKPMPYGVPTMYEKDYLKTLPTKGDDVRLVHISFDAFRPKNKTDKIGHIQCGGMNAPIFGCSGTEYLYTNIVNGVPVGEWTLKDDNKKIIPNRSGKRIELVLWDFELDSILEQVEFLTEKEVYSHISDMYVKTGDLQQCYETESVLLFKSDIGFYKEVIDTFTKMKIEGKETNNPALEAFAKLVLNSFYGKLASDPNRIERNLVFNVEGMANFINTDVTYQDRNKYYKAFASATTAWGRVNLRSTMYKIGFQKVVYFDTDSLYTTVSSSYIESKCGDILHKSELGKWDIEKEYSQIKSIGAKKYMVYGAKNGKNLPYENTCKCAGLPEKVRETLNFNDFYLGNTFNNKLAKVKVVGGYSLIGSKFTLHKNSFY